MTRFALLIPIALTFSGCAAMQKGGTLASTHRRRRGDWRRRHGRQSHRHRRGRQPGGLAAGAGLNAMGDSRVRAAAEEGYQKGQSDSIKQHYWMLQAQQERTASDTAGTQHYYDVTVPPTVDSYGVRRVPARVTLPIVE